MGASNSERMGECVCIAGGASSEGPTFVYKEQEEVCECVCASAGELVCRCAEVEASVQVTS